MKDTLMKVKVALIVLVATTACGRPIALPVDLPPEVEEVTRQVEQVTTLERCPWSAEEERHAKVLFEHFWKKTFDRSIHGMTDLVTVVCTTQTHVAEGYDVPIGITPTPFTIIVSSRDGDGEARPLYETSFWHELTHAILWMLHGDPDVNHREPPGPWLPEHDQLEGSVRVAWRTSLDE